MPVQDGIIWSVTMKGHAGYRHSLLQAIEVVVNKAHSPSQHTLTSFAQSDFTFKRPRASLPEFENYSTSSFMLDIGYTMTDGRKHNATVNVYKRVGRLEPDYLALTDCFINVAKDDAVYQCKWCNGEGFLEDVEVYENRRHWYFPVHLDGLYHKDHGLCSRWLHALGTFRAYE